MPVKANRANHRPAMGGSWICTKSKPMPTKGMNKPLHMKREPKIELAVIAAVLMPIKQTSKNVVEILVRVVTSAISPMSLQSRSRPGMPSRVQISPQTNPQVSPMTKGSVSCLMSFRPCQKAADNTNTINAEMGDAQVAV